MNNFWALCIHRNDKYTRLTRLVFANRRWQKHGFGWTYFTIFSYKNDTCTLQFHKHKWFKAYSASNSQVEAILKMQPFKQPNANFSGLLLRKTPLSTYRWQIKNNFWSWSPAWEFCLGKQAGWGLALSMVAVGRARQIWLTTRAAREAVGMIEVTHCLASLARSIHTFSTFYTNTYKAERESKLKSSTAPGNSSRPLIHNIHIPPSGPKSMSSSPWIDSSTQESSRRLQWNKCMEINPKLRGAKPLLVFQCRDWGWLQTENPEEAGAARKDREIHTPPANNSASPRNNLVRPSQQSAPPHDIRQPPIKQFSPSPKDFSLALSTNTISSTFVCSESHWENESVSHI